MKYCQNCGAEMPDDGLFCANCGSKAVEQTAQPVNQEQVQQSINPTQVQQPDMNYVPAKNMTQNVKPPKKPLSKKAKAIITGCVAIAVIAIVAIVCIVIYNKNKKGTVDIMDYVVVDFNGFDTIGTAKVTLDKNAFKLGVLEAQGMDIDEDDDYGDIRDMFSSSDDYQDTMQNIKKLINSIELEVTPNEGLSNDNTVTVTVTYDEDIVDDNDIILKADSKDFVVAGLSAITEITPFDYIEVTFSGTAPFAKAKIGYVDRPDILKYVKPTFDKDSELDLNDKITLTYDENQIEKALQKGYRFKETTKEYVVEDVDHYLTKFEDITSETINTIKSKAEEKLQSYLDARKNSYTYADLKYAGIYYNVKKETTSYGTKNIMYVVYSATIKSTKNSFKDSTVYFPVEYQNVIGLKDGTQEYGGYGNIIGTTDLSYGWFSKVPGYTDDKAMYEELITGNAEDYTCYVSGLKDYSNSSNNNEETSAAEDGTDAKTSEDVNQTGEAETTTEAQ